MQSSATPRDGRSLFSSAAVKRILLVEDEPDLAVLLKDYLEGYFYRVTTVGNGVDGLKAIMDSDFDVVRSEEHTSELQSQSNLVCRLLLEKKKKQQRLPTDPQPRDRTGMSNATIQ